MLRDVLQSATDKVSPRQHVPRASAKTMLRVVYPGRSPSKNSVDCCEHIISVILSPVHSQLCDQLETPP
jgi:hypothetical protein